MLYAIGENLPQATRKLNLLLRIAESWATTWGMKFNHSKSVTVVFSKKRHRDADEEQNNPVIFCGAKLQHSSTHKHLGVTLSADMTYRAHVEAVAKKVASELFLLRRLACRIRSKDIVREAYVRYVRPHFEYAAPVLASLPLNMSERLEKLQRRAMRIILNLPYRHPITDEHYSDLAITPLYQRRNLASACYGFKLFHRTVPRALHPFCPDFQVTVRPQMRHPRLMVPGIGISSAMLDRSPVMYASTVLNRLPANLLLSPSMQSFKSSVWRNYMTALS